MFPNTYRKIVLTLGVYALLVFSLEAMGIMVPGFSLLDAILALVGIYSGCRLVAERTLSGLEKIAAVLPFTLFLSHFSLIWPKTGEGAWLSTLLAATLTVIAFILVGKIKKEKVADAVIDVEMGEYPICLSDDCFITTEQVFEHVHVIGKTGSGKEENYFHNAQWQSMEQGKGFFHLDLKSEELELMAYYAQEHGREKDLVVLDLLRIERSSRINPLAWFKANEKGEEVPDSEWIAQIVETSIYRGSESKIDLYPDQGKKFLENFTKLFLRKFPIITYADFYHLIAHELDDLSSLKILCDEFQNSPEAIYMSEEILNVSLSRRRRNLSGVFSLLSPFVTGPYAPLINAKTPDVLMADILKKNKIFYLGAASLVYVDDYQKIPVAYLMGIMKEALQRGPNELKVPFDIFLEEVIPVLYPDFWNEVEKLRGKGVGCHLGYKSLNDLEKNGPEKSNPRVLDERTTKIVFQMDSSDPQDQLARFFGKNEVDVFSVNSIHGKDGEGKRPFEPCMNEDPITHELFWMNLKEMTRLNRGEALVQFFYQNQTKRKVIQFSEAPKPSRSFDMTFVVPELGHHHGKMEGPLPFKIKSGVR